jgi:hypothetical protein
VVDALDVEVFGLLGGAFDGEHLEGTDFWQDKDEAGEEVAAEAGRVAIFFPVVFSRCLDEVFSEGVEVGAGGIGGKVFFVQDGFGAGDVGKKAAGGEAVDTDGCLPGADDVGQLQAVGLEECFGE